MGAQQWFLPHPPLVLAALRTGTCTTHPAAAAAEAQARSGSLAGLPQAGGRIGVHTPPSLARQGAAPPPTAPKSCCQAWPGAPCKPCAGFAEVKGHLCPTPHCMGSLGRTGVTLFYLHGALLLSPCCQTLGEDSNPLSGRWVYPQSLFSPGDRRLGRVQDYPLGGCEGFTASCAPKER